ncbi:TlpA family protein disulfide reductase [Actinoplanes sp. NPDC051859]|uniref:TlpA family protein disulfide reductase n=1 Tax=Actinoplanes sp. NPDC051859 TaxID=3363909 RepID=UPI0037A94DF8
MSSAAGPLAMQRAPARWGPARWLTPPLVALLAACTASSPGAGGTVARQDPVPSPFADCATLTAPAAAAASTPGPLVGSSPSPAVAALPPDLPDLTLPCFTGDTQVRLLDLRGPAVINLWGSWCGPCREELPVMQELADATTGRLQVIGVDTRDDREAGASFAAGRGIRMATLFDREQKLLGALGRMTLPVTVFLDASGKRFVYTGRALDKPALGALVQTHTGVTVTG